MILPQLDDDLFDENPFGKPFTDEDFDALESIVTSTGATFWNSTPQLQKVAWEAFNRDASAWALLLCLIINHMSRLEPHVVLVAKNGKPGVGNVGSELEDSTATSMYAALLGDTGGGKSELFKLANGLIPPEYKISDATAQGIYKEFACTDNSYQEKGINGDPIGEPYRANIYHTHSIVLQATEVDALTAEFDRPGTKTPAALRKLWIGESDGTHVSDQKNRVALRMGTYRFAGIWGVQPEKAAGILADVAGGTPQRWTWAPAEEFRDTVVRTPPPSNTTFPRPAWNIGGNLYSGVGKRDMPDVIGPDTQLPSPIWVHWSPKMHQEIPPLQVIAKEARRKVRKARLAGALTDDMRRTARRVYMDSHIILTRIKAAAGLAFFHGRGGISDLDWELSEYLMKVSLSCLSEAWIAVEDVREEETIKEGEDHGKRMAASDAERASYKQERLKKLAQTLLKRIKDAPHTKTSLLKGWKSGKYRDEATEAFESLIDSGYVETDYKGKLWTVKDGVYIRPDGYSETEFIK